MPSRPLRRQFYRRDPETVARALLGQTVERTLDSGEALSGRIVEVEAYLGLLDRAAHTFGGRRTKRNQSMWLDGGHAYVYFVYGMHWCFNVVTEREGAPTACLVRALEPVSGIETMRRHRGVTRDRDLCSGPAKLAQAFAIDRGFDGVDLTSDPGLCLKRGPGVSDVDVERGPRVGVDYAEEWAGKPLRLWIRDSPHVSRSRG